MTPNWTQECDMKITLHIVPRTTGNGQYSPSPMTNKISLSLVEIKQKLGEVAFDILALIGSDANKKQQKKKNWKFLNKENMIWRCGR